ncbi:uncharacterized protein BXZ73DRAFT_97807 [Epithele typhae]|uniref:uncharacterized protein n=1 Tax=Epithele typhae TaxID=378194 RepID=UPI002008D871|nr:uncharacterized protein BXZ73DRAFT_97807 [Epithele typhae]KAH9942395.1 hypothetical protein BXZ73DRAFT_97807 [Epithele typhae]
MASLPQPTSSLTPAVISLLRIFVVTFHLVMVPDPNPTPRAPFDDDDADITFRSSDGDLFNLHKLIIAKASSVMRDTFTLPEASLPQTVDLAEDAKTLDALFRLIYPAKRLEFASLDDVCAVLSAAHKYDIPTVVDNLHLSLRLLVPSEPLRVYAVAYGFRMEALVRETAKLLARDPRCHIPVAPPRELHTLPAIAIYHLTLYHEDIAATTKSVAEDLTWMFTGNHTWTGLREHGSGSKWPKLRRVGKSKSALQAEDLVTGF